MMPVTNVVGLLRKCAWACAPAGIGLFLMPLSVGAQVHRVELISAETVVVERDSVEGEIRRLTGNVRMREDTTSLRADEAVQYVDDGEVFLSGNVRIINGNDTLLAEYVTYRSQIKMADFSGGGTIFSEGAVLETASGRYQTDSKIARTDFPLTLTDSSGVLYASRGRYDVDARRADLAGDVAFRRSDSHLDADSLVYFRRTERARAFGRVVLTRYGESRELPREDPGGPTDLSRQSMLFAERIVYDGQEESASVPAGDGFDPLLVLLREDSLGAVDTTLLRAKEMDLVVQETDSATQTRITAQDSVRLVRAGQQARADSLVVIRDAEEGGPVHDRAWLYAATMRPRMWAGGAQITADTLSMESKGEAIQHVDARGDAFVAQVDSALGRVNQLAGPLMRVLFRDDEIRTLSVWPKALAVYHRATPNDLLGSVEELAADSMTFRFLDGELRDVLGSRNVDGTSTAGNQVNGEVRLSGYAFTPSLRPEKRRLLDSDGWVNLWLTTGRRRMPQPVIGIVPTEAGSDVERSSNAEAP